MLGPKLLLYWRDNNGRDSQNHFWFPANLTIAQYVARANILRDRCVPLSSAQLVGGALYFEGVVAPIGGEGAEPDLRRNIVMFFSDAAGSASIRVPSPSPALPYDLAGEWRGIRVQRSALQAAGLLGQVEAIASRIVYQWGDPYPTTFVVAGLDYVVP